jgi:hypothetical protein
MTTIEILSILNACGAALTGAREWVPNSSPEAAPITAALERIRIASVELRSPAQTGAPDPILLRNAACALRNYAIILPPGCPDWHNVRHLANGLARLAGVLEDETEHREPTEVW